ncbi:hypothetical protein KAW65_08805 [candidate division WOR-3 bacterium]|nr:hypothetical protein [candidate division WOR-3 bacterium]
MSFLPIFLFQSWGIGGGILSFDTRGEIPLFNVHYLIEIKENFVICESMEYWQKPYKAIEGTRSKECQFSDLSFKETALFKLNMGKISIGIGPGLGIHLLKNCVKDRKECGSWIITEYYTLNSNSIGFHIETIGSIKFSDFLLSSVVRWGLIFVNNKPENLFYTQGNIKETSYLICFSW